MNTNQPTNNISSQGVLDKFRGKFPGKLVPVLIGMGLLSHAPDSAVAQGVPLNVPTMAQTGTLSETRQVENNVAAILEQPPVDALRVRAIQILTYADKKKHFRSVAEQEEFFHILMAIQQNKKTIEQSMITEYRSGGDYLKLFTDEFLKNIFQTKRPLSSELVTYMLN